MAFVMIRGMTGLNIKRTRQGIEKYGIYLQNQEWN